MAAAAHGLPHAPYSAARRAGCASGSRRSIAMPLDLDVPITKISPATQRIVDSAVVDAHRRGHTEVTTAHLFVSLSRAQWKLLAQVFREYRVDGHAVMRTVDEELRADRHGDEVSLHMSPAARL